MTAIERYKDMVEKELEKRFVPDAILPQKRLLEAMNYSLTAGGKRLRPILVLLFCEASGKSAEDALPLACALEMLHTYSLIHDDLPCMDNDDLRRGNPTNHKVFGEAGAILAGDALQAEAFGAILRCGLPPELRAACAEALADAAGVDGICAGQQLDMEGEERELSEDEISFLQSAKTGSLFVAACKIGAIAGGADESKIEAACLFGAALGAAFQIRDDMLDEISSEAEMGKTIGKDKRGGKKTFMTLYGEEKCSQMIERLTQSAKRAVTEAFPESSDLCALADSLCERRS